MGPRGAATWPYVPSHIRAGLTCHVSAAGLWRYKPPFLHFLKELKIDKYQNNIQKNLENSEINIFINITPIKLKFSPLDQKFLHL